MEMARKFIPTVLNPSEITLTLDELESSLTGYELMSAFFEQQCANGKWHPHQYVN